MFTLVLFIYFLVGVVMASVCARTEPLATLRIAAGTLSSISLIIPLGKRVPVFVGLFYLRVTDEERSIKKGGFRKPFVGSLDLVVRTWRDRALLMRTGLNDVICFFAWVFTLYAVLTQGLFFATLGFWKNVLLWLPRLFVN